MTSSSGLRVDKPHDKVFFFFKSFFFPFFFWSFLGQRTSNERRRAPFEKKKAGGVPCG